MNLLTLYLDVRECDDLCLDIDDTLLAIEKAKKRIVDEIYKIIETNIITVDDKYKIVATIDEKSLTELCIKFLQ